MAAVVLAALILGVIAAVAIVDGRHASGRGQPPSSVTAAAGPTTSSSPTSTPPPSESPAGAPVDVYSSIESARLAPQVANIPARVYVPNNYSNDVSVIDPRTFKVIYTFPAGTAPQHITPSWDMRHLYVGNAYGNTLTEVDPRTGRPSRTIQLPDPYNLYFTPDGKSAIDVAEGLDMIFFYDPRTWRLKGATHIPFRGPDHMDFSADGSYLLISTEYAGRLLKIDVATRKVVASVELGGSLVDVKLSPDGKVFYVANQLRGGVSVINPAKMSEIAFIPTGNGAHGFAISRNTRDLYVSNRLSGSVSVISFATNKVLHTWQVGGSPDMLQVSADGAQLWTTNRFNASVSVIDTRTGKVLHTIAVGQQPHGLTLFPQPGKYCLGHNGVYR